MNFDSRGGSIVNSQLVAINSILTPPSVTKTGNTLEGWYTSINGGETLETKWNFFTDRVNFDFTLYAKWIINQYTITFETNSGNTILNQNYDYNATLSIPNPSKVGHSFAGWFTDVSLTQAFTLTLMPASNLTLYAKWNINQYTITFETNGGNIIPSITGNYGDPITPPQVPTRTGYTFINWFEDSSLTTVKNLPNFMPDEDFTLFAKWGPGAVAINSNFPVFEGDKIITQSLGSAHSSAITSTGRVFMWGRNAEGQLGDGTNINRSLPIEITNRFSLTEGDKIIDISLGNWHSAALSLNGRVFTWGENSNGNLGNSTVINANTPIEITDRFTMQIIGEKIITIEMGGVHSSALTSAGRVFMWGRNSEGQLGTSNFSDRSVPTEITSRLSLILGEKVVSIALGGFHSSALSSLGRVLMWGNNYNGMLGDGTNNNENDNNPIDITSGFYDENIVSLSLGQGHSSALSSSGRLFMWGWNIYGQLGNNLVNNTHNGYGMNVPVDITSYFLLFEDEKIIHHSLGAAISSALTSNGRLFIWGLNTSGQLLDGTTVNKHIPIEITSRFTPNNNDEVINLRFGKAQFLGEAHFSVLTQSGQLFMWGYSDLGQLGFL